MRLPDEFWILLVWIESLGGQALRNMIDKEERHHVVEIFEVNDLLLV